MRGFLSLCGCTLLLAGAAHGGNSEEPQEKQVPTLLELFLDAPIVVNGALQGGGNNRPTLKVEETLRGDLKPGIYPLRAEQVPAIMRFGHRKLPGYTLFIRRSAEEGALDLLTYRTSRGEQPAVVNLGGASPLILRAAKDSGKTLKDKNQIARNAAAIYLARGFVREHGPRRLPPEEVFGALLRVCDPRHRGSAGGRAGPLLVEEAQSVLREMGLEEAMGAIPVISMRQGALPLISGRRSVFRTSPGDWVKTMRGRIFAARDREAELRAAGGWEARLAAAVRDLAHEDFDVREKAEAELGAMGRFALEILREAAKSSDREVRERAGRLLEELEPMERYDWLIPPKTGPSTGDAGNETGADASAEGRIEP